MLSDRLGIAFRTCKLMSHEKLTSLICIKDETFSMYCALRAFCEDIYPDILRTLSRCLSDKVVAWPEKGHRTFIIASKSMVIRAF